MTIDIPMIVSFAKMYKYVIIPAALVVFGFGVMLSTTRSLQSPQDRLNQQIDEAVERAQRMLDGYQPAGRQFWRDLESSTTQPTDLPSADKWNDYLTYAEQKSPFTELLQRQTRQIRELTQEYARLSGQQRPYSRLSPADAAAAYEQLKDQLEGNKSLIKDALDIVQQAIRLRAEAGDETVSGDLHPTATRLEAILISYQAELLGQQAAARRAIADVERTRFAHLMSSWRELDSAIRSIESGFSEEVPDQVEASSEKGAEKAPIVKPVAPKKTSSATGKPGLIRKTLGRLLGAKGASQGGDRVPLEGGQPPAAGEQKPELSEDAPPRKISKPPTLAKRIAELQKRREEAAAQIKETRTANERLQAAIDGLSKRMEQAQSRTTEAQKRMVALEETKVDPADPESLETFIAEYNAASEIQREASREASILEFGSVRNAKPDTDDEDKMLAASLVPVAPGKEMVVERGLVALQDDLKSGQGLVETQEQLLAGISEQIEALSREQTELKDRLSRLQDSRAKLRDEGVEMVRSVVAALIEVHGLETEAIELLTNAGMQAAARARRAAETRMTKVRTFINAQNTTSPPDSILTKMASDRSIIGHTKCVEGDLQYLLALIQAQQANGFDRQHRLLSDAELMGIAGDQQLLPGERQTESVPASLFQADAAAAAAKEAREKAEEAAKNALEIYQQADDADLNQLWVLHTNRAAVHYLLASLESGKQAQAERNEALQMYEAAVRGRDDLQQARAYQSIIETLKQTGR